MKKFILLSLIFSSITHVFARESLAKLIEVVDNTHNNLNKVCKEKYKDYCSNIQLELSINILKNLFQQKYIDMMRKEKETRRNQLRNQKMLDMLREHFWIDIFKLYL